MPCGAISVSSEEVVGSSEPCGVELSHADGADFRRSMWRKFCVFPWILSENKICSCVLMSKKRRSKFCVSPWVLCENKICSYVLMSQKNAEQILCQSVSVQWFLTEEHMFLTQRSKVSQSVCVVLRSLRAIFHTDMEYTASFHVLRVSTGIFLRVML